MENFSDLLEEYNVDLNKKDIYTGEVRQIERSFVLVDSNFKSDVIIPMEDFTGFESKLALGEIIEYQIKDFDDGFGQVIGTRKPLTEIKKWKYFEDFQNENKTITGLGVKASSGGLVVRIKDVNCFIPKSLLDTNYRVTAEELIGKEIKAKIMKINKEKDGVVLSRKAQIQEDNNIKFPENGPVVGDIVSGVVKNIADFGAFIDLGYKDALLHISEISWTKVESISALLKEGDQISCEVVSVSGGERPKISLSLKSLIENPWKQVSAGDVVKAIVTKKEKCLRIT